MPANAVHQSKSRRASTSMAGANSSARAAIIVEVVCLPEQQVDRVERRVVAEAWGRVDRDESALVAAVEDIAGDQVAV